MIYDEVELMKLNLTWESIQNQIDAVVAGLLKAEDNDRQAFIIIKDFFWLKFIIDELKGYKIVITPLPDIAADVVKIEVFLPH